MRKTLAALILAGGLSSRMGREKASLEIEKRPLIQWACEAAGRFSDNVYISVHDKQAISRLKPILPAGFTFVTDIVEGPRSVLLAFISSFPIIQEERVAVMPVDSPFMAKDVMTDILTRSEGFDLTIPMWPDGKLEAIHAVYDRTATLPILQSLWAERKLELREIAKRSKKTLFISTESLSEYDSALLSLLDADTPDEFAALQAARTRTY